VPDLRLDIPWIAPSEQLGDLRVHRASVNTLRYEDGIDLAVRVIDPSDYRTAEELIECESHDVVPGTVRLVAGSVPVAWRPTLRAAEMSFVDVSGVAEIHWPRLRFSTARFTRTNQRRRIATPMQKGHAVIVQELLSSSFRGEQPSIGDLAQRAGVGLSTASRAIAQLADHGLVEKRRHGSTVQVEVIDAVTVAELLSSRTSWPHGATVSGYLWGRSVWDVAASISARASRAGIAVAVTGRTALAFHGVLGTSSPAQTRCWVAGSDEHLEENARSIGLEPAPDEASNVILAADPWNVGLHRRASREFEKYTAIVAQPLRTWCDVREEPRGREFAAQLWKEIGRYG
jgi:DNA-binding transcriptional ArsR family regulator